MALDDARLRMRTRALDAGQRLALAQATWAWAISRVLCWGVGIAAVLAVGANAGPHDLGHLTAPFGTFGNDLVGPAARWDSHWYLLIADHGYVTPMATVFYPLFPLLARIVGTPFGSSLVGGMIVSLAGLLAALYLLHRLVMLELGSRLATRTMLLLAFFPTAVFFSAVYTEGLFLALSVGAVYAARRGRWAVAGIAGGLAELTRPNGMLLLVPLALLYLYGPRADKAREPGGGPPWRPRHQPGIDLVWLLAVPAGLILYMAYVGVELGHPFLMLHEGKAWGQSFTFPLVTFARSAGNAASGLAQVAHGHAPGNVYEFGFLCVAIVAAIGALRRLPLAYGAYAAIGIVAMISVPIHGESLSGFSRYVAPLFPLLMWVAAWSSERRLYRPILVVFALLMMVNAARFATWHFVA